MDQPRSDLGWSAPHHGRAQSDPLSWRREEEGLPAIGPIYFSSLAQSANHEIFSIQPDGTGLRRVTYDPPADQMPDVSRAGQKIVFISQGSGFWEIHSMNADGSKVRPLTSFMAGEGSMPYRCGRTHSEASLGFRV